LPEADRYPQSLNFRVLLARLTTDGKISIKPYTEWNKALAVQDNAQLREAVARAQRERDVFRFLFGTAAASIFCCATTASKNEKLSGAISE